MTVARFVVVVVLICAALLVPLVAVVVVGDADSVLVVGCIVVV